MRVIDVIERRFRKLLAHKRALANRLARFEKAPASIDPEFRRASCSSTCEICGLSYGDHVEHPSCSWLTILCDGTLVKL